MRALGYWQRYFLKYFADNIKNKDDNKYKEGENKTIDNVENKDEIKNNIENENYNKKNNKKCIIF